MIENDWLDHDFIDDHTVGFDAGRRVRAASGRRAKTAEVTGIAEQAIRQAAEWWGTAKTSFLMHARGIEQHSQRRAELLGAINIVLAIGRIGRPDCGYATITGQGNGQGGREHGQKCDQLPGGRDIANPEHRALHRRRLGHRRAGAAAAPGVDCLRDLPQDRRAARSRACCRSASTRSSRCRTTTSSRGCSRSSSSSSRSTSS